MSFCFLFLGTVLYTKSRYNKLYAATQTSQADLLVTGLPNYNKDDVKKHNNKNEGIWMTYKNGVYDVTDYIGDHPGGLSIMLSAGQALEPFFAVFKLHYHDFVLNKLENFRIGNILEKGSVETESDLYKNDPKRDPGLTPLNKTPFNAESQISSEQFLTPNNKFFVRNHFPVPEVNEKDYRLNVCRADDNQIKTVKNLSLDQLKRKFQKKHVIATIQCVENRRNEMRNFKRLYGLKWGHGAIGNAKWSGVSLEDILKHAGIDLENGGFSHIHFEGFDKDPSGNPYVASVPIELIMKCKQDIILAYEMNNEELSRDHGYPIRVVLPGISGARHVKWLHKISLSKQESIYHWQHHYKPFLSAQKWNDVNFNDLPSIQDMPVQAAICDPPNDFKIDHSARRISVSGYAWSGGGRSILFVELSVDGGKTWKPVILNKNDQREGSAYAWTLWQSEIDIPNGSDKIEIICRAVDSSLNSQPSTVAHVWNFCGVLNNAWHRVTILRNKEQDRK